MGTTGVRRKKKMIDKGLNVVATANLYGQYKDVDDIEKQLVNKLSTKDQQATSINMLIIMDDIIGDIKAYENDQMQTQLFFNRRHLLANGTVSIIIVS